MVLAAFAHIDVKNAEAGSQADQDMILGAVEGSVGFDGLNRVALDRLRAWILDVARELLGPDVRYHHSKLNFKLAGAGGRTRVHWHQDIQFWPHTNYSPLTVGVYLEDTDEAMGPMHVLPLSVHDELHPLEDAEGTLAARATQTTMLIDIAPRKPKPKL